MDNTSNQQPAEGEFITHESGNEEAWICACGNTPSDGGFYPVNEANPENHNREVEPDANWTSGEYVCATCGRVIDQHTLQVTRRVDLNTFDWLP